MTTLARRQNFRKLISLGMIIEKSLLKSNHQSVRLNGFELLLYFIEALQNSIGDSQIKLFESAINLQPFVTPDTKVSRIVNTLLTFS